ncbi:MAG: GTP-binding protein [Thermodesulfobacteriota bacterium]|nr:GTP-binding protein [Thermodesulfobacteriota bacterium]|tara:strand:+ start:2613 stop:3866 length:1254 start_codon:yes stop_codon:yes gene_type:complete
MSDSIDILRFATAGSVDDGKSTLIGRLLFDTKGVFTDQLEALEGTSYSEEQKGIDLALITDGLKAEREQGITIDVAYRYFSTPKRKFIIADTPGHVQYTRNMFTGASNSDLAIILIDSRNGVQQQSKRHLYISWLLGIKNIIVAINKMDLIDYDKKRFDYLSKDFLSITKNLSIPHIDFVPISALKGDMIVSRGENMKWYKGPTLIEILETVEINYLDKKDSSRFPVQLVNRVNDETTKDFRGYMGTLMSGTLAVGDSIKILPSNRETKIKEIILSSMNVDTISSDDSATIVLDEEIDISRGDMFSSIEDQPEVSNTISARICWMDEQKLNLKNKYLLKHCNKISKALIKEILYKVDMETLNHVSADSVLEMNDIAQVEIMLQNQIAFDSYKRNKKTGSFIIIDSESNNTVAAGTIL